MTVKIHIGNSGSKRVCMDMDVLLRTRLLITSNSGGGKSWLIRRIVEQCFGKIQIIIIDPEGEFATLREKFSFVLAGKGGDTPADIRSAELLAQRLLELRASCVCDIFEMKPFDRHRWVKLFLDSMLNAPKKLWHPVLVVVDESHKFCPEKGAGESEASEAMVGLCTTGRKRGFCAVFATQRLGKLRKDASAELLNRLVGPTFEDVDRKRAADLLGILKSDEKEFFHQIQMLEPGNFFALGRAISTERLMVHVGDVTTTHPEVGAKYSDSPPPPTSQVVELLPKLADLPKQAEDKARTVSEMQTEIRSLKAQLRSQPKEQVVVKGKSSAADRATIKRLRGALESAMRIITNITASGFDGTAVTAEDVKSVLEKASVDIVRIAATTVARRNREFDNLKREAKSILKKIESLLDGEDLTVDVSVRRDESVTVRPIARTVRARPVAVVASSNGDLPGPEQRILNAIAWMESIGVSAPKQTAVAFLAGYTFGGGGFNNPRGALRTKGLLDYRGDTLVLTDSGRGKAHAPNQPLSTPELHSRVLDQLPGPERKILQAVLAVYPESISDEKLAEASGYTHGGGGYNNPRGRLRTLNLVDYPERGMVRAADLLFVD